MRNLPAVLALALLVCACAGKGRAPAFSPASAFAVHTVAERMTGTSHDWAPTLDAIHKSLVYVQRKNPDAVAVAGAKPPVTWARIRETLEHLLVVLPQLQTQPDLLQKDFEWQRVIPDPLMTGYYEPVLEASNEQTAEYNVPIYGVPSSLRTVDLGAFKAQLKGQQIICRIENGSIVPFYTRQEIDSQGALNATEQPLVWTKDSVDVFFLQVQGSGLLRYPDGHIRHVLYAGKNGREYVSLGKVLIERGFIPREEMSMQRIRSFLASRPDVRQELLNTNPSYVFFRLADDGPYGSMGQTLTPMVSMATDLGFLPSGCVLAVDADLPSSIEAVVHRTFLGLAQDTGGAIKGNRLDLFCGHDGEAEFLAGHLQGRSSVYLLLKRE